MQLSQEQINTLRLILDGWTLQRDLWGRWYVESDGRRRAITKSTGDDLRQYNLVEYKPEGDVDKYIITSKGQDAVKTGTFSRF